MLRLKKALRDYCLPSILISSTMITTILPHSDQDTHIIITIGIRSSGYSSRFAESSPSSEVR